MRAKIYDATQLQIPIGEGKATRVKSTIGFVDITIAAESANAILVTFDAKDLGAHEDLNREYIAVIRQYEDATGTIDSEVVLGDPVYDMTVTTGTLQSPFADGLELSVRSDITGTIAITLTDSSAVGTSTKYLGFQCGDFFCQTGALTFA